MGRQVALEEAQQHRRHRDVGLLVDAPAVWLVGQVGEPRVTRARDEQGLDRGAGRAERGDEALGLVVVDDGVLLAVDDEVRDPLRHALGLDSLKRREPAVILRGLGRRPLPMSLPTGSSSLP